jgi:copper chaperone NosL
MHIKTNSLPQLTRTALLMVAVFLSIAIFVPLWSIDLDAPQYPEGLRMLIYADGVKGDVEIINGLNHYIGMKTIHNEDFLEFKILPYLIAFLALPALFVAIRGRKLGLYIFSVIYILFGILSIYDFWKWEYDYGHNLDPNAAIIVPGMAYQPPLIGFKQLLNFGAYSLPALGGWLFILAGILLLVSSMDAMGLLRVIKNKTLKIGILLFIGLNACNSSEPVPIRMNRDQCDYCKMRISNAQFGAELITSKGRVFKFDDLFCLFGFRADNQGTRISAMYVHDYLGKNELIKVEDCTYLKGGKIVSPMGGNIAAFRTRSDAQKYIQLLEATETKWTGLNP